MMAGGNEPTAPQEWKIMMVEVMKQLNTEI